MRTAAALLLALTLMTTITAQARQTPASDPFPRARAGDVGLDPAPLMELSSRAAEWVNRR